MSGGGDQSDKTEQPTQKKLRDALKKGDVMKSKEVVSSAMVVGMFIYFSFAAENYLDSIEGFAVFTFDQIPKDYNIALRQLLTKSLEVLFTLLAPLMGLAVAIAILSNISQTGIIFSWDPIKPDLKKLDPIKAIKNLFSMKSVVEILKSLVKVVVLSAVIYLVIRDSIELIFNLPDCGLRCFLPILVQILMRIFTYTGIAFVAVAALDFIFQKKQYIKKMMMSRDEIKREYKEQEGDPQIKGKRKELHRELLSGNMAEQVSDSSVVVVNPVHIAVGIQYKETDEKLPTITFMKRGPVAREMVKMAKELGIPVMQNVPLAQGLYRTAKVDDYIPSDLIEPVAEVLKWALNSPHES